MPAFPKPTATETDPVAGPNLTTHTALTTTAHGGIVASDDARLTNARTPTAHKTTHATGQSDAIAPSDIGAATAAQGAKADSAFPADTASVVMWVPPAAQTNWSSYSQNAAAIGDFTLTSSGAQNALVAFDVWLSAGTWSVLLMYIKHTDQGIITVSIDGTDVGTVDAYGASLTYNNITAITGVAVASSGRKRVQLKMATKNASASNYYCRFQQLAFVRTA